VAPVNGVCKCPDGTYDALGGKLNIFILQLNKNIKINKIILKMVLVFLVFKVVKHVH
jgi:hypothetical protein